MIINCTELKKIIVKDKNINELLKEAFFFDIETTGLSYKSCSIISITTLLYDNGKYKIYQMFCEYRHDEKEMIKYFMDLVKEKKYVITYNGNTFDIPFITNKSFQLELNFNFDKFMRIDLYNDIRHLRSKITINDLKLKTVEEYFKIKRDDTISGQDVIILYEAFKIEPRKEFTGLILQHNYEDVYNLPLLLENLLNLYDVLIHYDNLIVKINYSDFSLKKNTLSGNLYIISDFKKNLIYPSLNFDLKIDIISQILNIKIPVGLYKDNKIKEFYYLNNDDFNIISYTAIKGIKKNLIPLKFNEEICNNNLIIVIRKILDSIFM